jgi:hypothetical protein
MCQGNWEEVKDKSVKFPEVDSETFGVYVGWLNIGAIDLSKEGESTPKSVYDPNMSDDERSDLYNRIIDAYAFGDMVQDETFRNALCDEIIQLADITGWNPWPIHGKRLFGKVPKQSKMVSVFIDFWFSSTLNCPWSDISEVLPKAFLVEMANAAMEEQDMTPYQRNPAERPKCFYHDHEATDKCN